MDRYLSLTNSFSRRRGLAVLAATGAALTLGRRASWAQDSAGSPAATLSRGEASWTKYNLNTISDEQILSIPGAGDRMTREFAEYRPYATIGQFRAEIGKYVDEDVVASYERYVFVPIDPANPDTDTIAQMPGIDPDEAGELAAGSYADDAAFLAALTPLISAEQAGSAPAYLASAATPAVTWTKYNLNTISDEQILSIPATGDRMTREFAEYRPYTTIGQFRAEIGKYVDKDVVAGYEAYAFVPIDPANPDEDTLAQLPGVGSDKAAQLADGGPYADNAAFLAALAPLVSADQAALATAYLASGE